MAIIRTVKDRLRSNFPNLYHTAYAIKGKMIGLWHSAVFHVGKVCYGQQNPDKKILVIRIRKPALFGICIWVLEYIRYAEKEHFVPVVDMMSFSNPYYKKGTDPERNIWECLFDLGGVKLEEAYQSRNVYLTNPDKQCEEAFRLQGLTNNGMGFAEWYLGKRFPEFARLCNQYLVPASDIGDEAADYIREYFSHGKVLGVSVRGTDYMKGRPQGHSVQPEFSRVLSDTEKYLGEWGCDRIYLSTEDEEAERMFRDKFGDKLIAYDELRYGHETANLDLERRENDRYLGAREYLLSKYILSQCACFIGARTGGNLVALGWNNKKYEKVFLYDLGYYQINENMDNSMVICN